MVEAFITGVIEFGICAVAVTLAAIGFYQCFALLGVFVFVHRFMWRDYVCVKCGDRQYEAYWARENDLHLRGISGGKVKEYNSYDIVRMANGVTSAETHICVWTPEELACVKYLYPKVRKKLVEASTEPNGDLFKRYNMSLNGFDFTYCDRNNDWKATNIFRYLATHGKPSRFIVDGELRIPLESSHFCLCWRVKDERGFDMAIAKLALTYM